MGPGGSGATPPGSRRTRPPDEPATATIPGDATMNDTRPDDLAPGEMLLGAACGLALIGSVLFFAVLAG